ncbi:hypothetical protein CCMA1212_000454 [Trichoderma ghanense]|uniref:Uncharacterized protein n=1 Tax=Trichoderma ghanense TaxID=65468 RepID=A0ABY2HFW7_9HYPO
MEKTDSQEENVSPDKAGGQPAREAIRRQKPRFLQRLSYRLVPPALVLTRLAFPPSSLHFVLLKALLRRIRDSRPIVAAGPGQPRVRPARFLAHATSMLEGGIHSSAYKLAPTRSLRPDRRS